MDYIKTLDTSVTSVLNDYVKKPTIIRGIVHLLLILYAARLAPSLPAPVLMLFENQYFKLFIFSLILWTAQFSPSTSILIALAFMITVNYSTNKPLWEFLENTTEEVPSPSGPSTPVEAVAALAQAAVTPTAAPPTEVTKVAEMALSPVKTEEGAEAIKILAEAAMAPEAAPTDKIEEVAKIAVESMAPPAPVPAETKVAEPAPVMPTTAPVSEAPKAVVSEPAGCYPIRHYDMSKVEPADGVSTQQEWSK